MSKTVIKNCKKLFTVAIAVLTVSVLSGSVCGADIKEWPVSIMLKCGDLVTRLDKAKAWNINRVEYRGFRLGVDRKGSHYGSVFRYPKIGFIGTGHTENQTEEVLTLKIKADNKYVAPGESLRGDEIVVEKTSRIIGTVLTRFTIIKNDSIEESVILENSEEQKLLLFYPFMFPLLPSCTHYAAGTGPDVAKSGTYGAERDFPVDGAVEWVAVFHADEGIGAVATILEYPQSGGFDWALWNVPGTYRKVYGKSFVEQTLPEDFSGKYRMRLDLFTADVEAWRQKAVACSQAQPGSHSVKGAQNF